MAGRLATLTRLVPVNGAPFFASRVAYSYNAMGQRVGRHRAISTACAPAGSPCSGAALPPEAVVFVYGQQGELLGEYRAADGAVLREYVWLGQIPVAVVAPNALLPGATTDIFHIHADHLDTPRVVLDTAGRQRWTWLSGEPFGATAPNTNPEGLGAFAFNLRFPGQYVDQDSGLVYNHFRDFDPTLGRYTQSDPIGLAGGINTYSYVGGNPISRVDPTGLDAMVCMYPGAGGFGHVGIGVNSSSTSGFYPRSNAPGNPVTGTAGIVQRDTKAANQCKAIETTPEQDRLMSEFMKMASQGTPSDYALLTNNCTNFVRDVLLQGGLSIPATSPRPDLFFRSLPGTPTRP